MTTPWILCRQRKPAAHCRLFCFPYAGGHSGTYRTWEALLPPEVELHLMQLPGRLQRFHESPLESVADIVAQCTQELLALTEDRPYALFGHSMGALVAYEVAQAMVACGRPPLRLYASARRAPQLPGSAQITYDLAPAAFVEVLRQLGGTPEAVLQSPELMQLVLPALRADFKAVETYRYQPRPPLPCPISVLGGRDDQRVGTEQLLAWQEQTAQRVMLALLPGGHFFIEEEAPAIVRIIASELAHVGPTPEI